MADVDGPDRLNSIRSLDPRSIVPFIVVGPDGEIRWRADYGGATEFTMYVTPDALLQDLREGLAAAP